MPFMVIGIVRVIDPDPDTCNVPKCSPAFAQLSFIGLRVSALHFVRNGMVLQHQWRERFGSLEPQTSTRFLEHQTAAESGGRFRRLSLRKPKPGWRWQALHICSRASHALLQQLTAIDS